MFEPTLLERLGMIVVIIRFVFGIIIGIAFIVFGTTAVIESAYKGRFKILAGGILLIIIGSAIIFFFVLH